MNTRQQEQMAFFIKKPTKYADIDAYALKKIIISKRIKQH